MSVEIAVIDDYQGVAHSFGDWSRLPSKARVTFFQDHCASEADLVDRLAPFEIVGVMRERTAFPRSLLSQLPSLRLLITTGRRNSTIDMEAADDLGITVGFTNSPGHATAELTMALILSLARNLSVESGSVSAGGWQVGVGRDLRGANLGLVGLGRLGSQVAEFAKAFGMEVGAWSENLTQERCAEVGVAGLSRDELFRSSDFVSVHLRLSQRTTGLVGAEEIEMMRPDAYLINTSRAAIVDEDALVQALTAGTIAGAALDVYEHEPLPQDHRFRATPRLLTTPHIGYVTRETYAVFYGEMVEAIAAYLQIEAEE
ncbi:MAG: D-2-hydroxyacid dehydrogenase family protein [Acidobacteria bacterium]|nr:D-2-hydroxyacid dehydrogenase family protein [Acidobacteriota bacterium]